MQESLWLCPTSSIPRARGRCSRDNRGIVNFLPQVKPFWGSAFFGPHYIPPGDSWHFIQLPNSEQWADYISVDRKSTEAWNAITSVVSPLAIDAVCTSVLMKLFLFIMGTKFTNISDAFLLTVSVYIIFIFCTRFIMRVSVVPWGLLASFRQVSLPSHGHVGGNRCWLYATGV